MNIESFDFLACARQVLTIEVKEAERLLTQIDDAFECACRLILNTTGKVVVSGIGKSGHIGHKIAATFASTGTPAFFVHSAEALHGDLGMISPNDLVIFISYSGRAKELELILPLLSEQGTSVIALTGDKYSLLARTANCVLNIAVQQEACPIGLAPTASAVTTLMMGDALAIALMKYRGFNEEDFARAHPGGALGARLLNRVYNLMRIGDRIPRITPETSIMGAMLELTRTGLGLVVVCDGEQVVGVFTDGDLRRWLMKEKGLNEPVTKGMTTPGMRLAPHYRASEALELLHQAQITAAPVVDSQGHLVGVLNLHDLHQAGII